MYHQYSDRQASANSADPFHMSLTAAYDNGLYFLPIIQQFPDTSIGSKSVLFKLQDKYD